MQCKSSGATYAHFLVEFCKKWIQVCEFVLKLKACQRQNVHLIPLCLQNDNKIFSTALYCNLGKFSIICSTFSMVYTFCHILEFTSRLLLQLTFFFSSIATFLAIFGQHVTGVVKSVYKINVHPCLKISHTILLWLR